jgi:hypothetical protein
MTLDGVLVLNRFVYHLLGAERWDDFWHSLADLEEGPGPDGHSAFFHALRGRVASMGNLRRVWRTTTGASWSTKKPSPAIAGPSRSGPLSTSSIWRSYLPRFN